MICIVIDTKRPIDNLLPRAIYAYSNYYKTCPEQFVKVIGKKSWELNGAGYYRFTIDVLTYIGIAGVDAFAVPN